MSDLSWKADAPCKGKDTNLWFPHALAELHPIVRKTCRSCPVQAQCLEHALALPEEHGVWGGATERERQKMRKGRPRQMVGCAWCGVPVPRIRREGIVLDAFCRAEECQKEASRRKHARSRKGQVA